MEIPEERPRSGEQRSLHRRDSARYARSPATGTPKLRHHLPWTSLLALVIVGPWMGGCLPPPIDEPSEEEVVGFSYFYDKVIPAAPSAQVVRTAGSSVEFDVRGAVQSLGDSTAPLFYSWYLDWTPEAPVAPLSRFEQDPVVVYLPCATDLDPVSEVDGSRPSRRTLMVVIASEPLASPEDAYLGAAEGSAVTYFDWNLEFVGADQCSQ